MGKASREAGKRERERIRRKKILRNSLIVAGIIVVIIGIMVISNIINAGKTAFQGMDISLAEDGSLHVDRTVLGNGFNYVNWGGSEELILYSTNDGEVMAAFDTCEECYPEGEVHFTRNGEEMVCSVCGTTSAVSDFGAQDWGGCQPVSIPTVARLDTDSEIIISGEAIDYAVRMFEQWDSGDMSVSFAYFEE